MTAQRAIWAAAALAAVGVLGCGGGGNDGPRRISYDASYWTEAGDVPVPEGFDRSALRVRQLDDGGRLVDLELEWDGDTAIVAEGARPPLYVSYGADMVVTDFDAIDVGRRHSGRPDLEHLEVIGATPTDVRLSGLDPDAAYGGSLYLSVPNAGVDTHLAELNVYGSLPTGGATEASFGIEFPYGHPIVDASRGDRSHVYQLSETDETFSAVTLTRHGTAQFSFTDGQLSADLAALEAGERVELSHETAAFAAMVDDMQPDVGPLRHRIRVVAHTGPAELATGTSATLALQGLIPQDAAVGAVDIPYGNPFGDGWRELVVATSSGEVALVLDDRPIAALEVASTTVVPADEARGARIAPALSAPRNLTLDGAATSPQLEVAGDQVVLAWAPPHAGTPTHYVVEIFEFGFGAELLGTVVTRDTQVVLSGAQLPGDDDPRTYRVSAVASECPVESRPFDQPMVRVEAQAVTGVIVRP